MNVKKSKYGNKRTVIDGKVFASKKEAHHYLILKSLSEAGAITRLQVQTVFSFELNGKTLFKYLADFTYHDSEGKYHVVDVKGFRTPTYRLKKKLVEAFHGVIIEEV